MSHKIKTLNYVMKIRCLLGGRNLFKNIYTVLVYTVLLVVCHIGRFQVSVKLHLFTAVEITMSSSVGYKCLVL